MTDRAEAWFKKLFFGVPPILDATVDKLMEALDIAETRLGMSYHAWVLPIDLGLYFGMEITLSELNDYIAESIAKDKKKRLVGFASVDPRRGEEGVMELERCVRKKGLRGLKLYPPMGFYPDDEKVYPIYEKVVELQKELKVTIPVLFHQGLALTQSKYARPIFLDIVATNFEPDLKIIAAHAGAPWIDELIWVAAVHPNLYIDIGAVADVLGLWPELYAEFLGKAIRGGLIDRILFASDWPCICALFKPDYPEKHYIYLHKWVNEFRRIRTPRVLRELGYPEITDDDKRKILGENAMNLIEGK